MYRTALALTALAAALSACAPFSAAAASSPPCPPAPHHALPNARGARTPVVQIGVVGGNMRPFLVTVNLDGSVVATGTQTSISQLPNPKADLRAMMALADGEKFFSMKKTLACPARPGNPDVGSRVLTIFSSTAVKHVTASGTCNTRFIGLYDLIAGEVGLGR